MAAETYGITGAGWKILGVLALLILYTFLWIMWWRPWIMGSIKWTAKRRKHNEASARKFATIAGTLATFVFFVGYIPLAAVFVRAFDLWNHPAVEGGKVWAGIGLALAYLFQSQFFSLILGGLKVLLLRAMKVGDYIQVNSNYGYRWGEGTVTEIDTHSTKLRQMDLSIGTLPNEALTHMAIHNYDYEKFHFKIFRIPVPRNGVHAEIGEDAMQSITALQSENIAKLDDSDLKWYKDHVEKTARLTANQAAQVSVTFSVHEIQVWVPIRAHINGLRLEHEVIEAYPELFGRKRPEVDIGKLLETKP